MEEANNGIHIDDLESYRNSGKEFRIIAQNEHMFMAVGAHHVEVFKKRVVEKIIFEHAEGKVLGRVKTGKFKYSVPTNENFGKWAWCYRTVDEALRRWPELRGFCANVEQN